jgi:hypothetical protein
MSKKLKAWLSESGYVAGKWRINIRDNGNEFTGPQLQYAIFSPVREDGTVLAYQKLDYPTNDSDCDSCKDS